MKPYLIRLFVAVWFMGMVVFAVWGSPVEGQGVEQKYLPFMTRHSPFLSNPSLHSYLGLLSSDSDGDFDIYSVRADGDALTRLTDNEVHDRDAQWSPNGRLIAFRQESSPNHYRLVVMNADGSDAEVVLEDPTTSVQRFEWSPTSDALLVDMALRADTPVFVTLVTLTTHAVHVMGYREYPWSLFGTPTPQWSSDGRYFFYISNSDHTGELWVASASGETRVLISAKFPDVVSWHPSQPRLLYADWEDTEQRTWLTSPTGTNTTLLFTSPYRFRGWLNHGTTYLLSAGYYAFYTLEPPHDPVPIGYGNFMGISPDGSTFAYETGYAVNLYHHDTGETTAIQDSCSTWNYCIFYSPTWARDGKSLLYANTEAEHMNGYRIEYTGLDPLQTTPTVLGGATQGTLHFLPFSSRFAVATPDYGAYPPPQRFTPQIVDTQQFTAEPLPFPDESDVLDTDWRYIPDGE